VRGTPSLYFNGRAYNGVMTADAMEKAIKQLQAGAL
jgi:protein-disulfide isomerase